MNDSEIRAFLTIALMAALADGAKDDRESAALKSLAGRLGQGRIDLTDVYDDVLVRKISIADAVRPITTTEGRRQAYETAVAVAAADGVNSPAERAFLRDLAAALGLPAEEAQGYVAQADAVVGAAGVAGASGVEPVRQVPGHVIPDAATLDRQIVNASVTNAALELLPESLASMAILPLQVRLVYQIGKAYGYELDQGHIKEFVATLGVGPTGQYLEQFGRTLDAGKLKAAFAPLLEQGQGLIGRYSAESADRARTIDVRNLPALIKSA